MAYGPAGYLEMLLAPPGGCLWLILAGLWLLYRDRRRPGLALAGGGLALLYLLATPLVSTLLMQPLQTAPALPLQKLADQGAQAIVVLGAGRREAAPEYDMDTLDSLALERVRYAALIARRTDLPVLVSGGLARDGHPPEAMLMMEALEAEFGIPVRWVEADSRTTWENARNSSRLLDNVGIERVLLVTHAWHMRRALWSFGRFDLQVVPAPTAFEAGDEDSPQLVDLLPSAHALRVSAFAFHEHLGYLWYRLRY